MTLLATSSGAKRALAGIAGVLLAADGLVLIALGYFNLGVVLPLAMGLGLCALALRWTPWQRWLAAAPRRAMLWRSFWWAAWLWLATLAAFWAVLATRTLADLPAAAPAAIVVLGSGSPGATASPTLTARLDLALRDALRHPQALVVVSGGISFRASSEAEVMAAYLQQRGLAAGRIVKEELSTSTQENLAFSRRLLAAAGVGANAPVHIVTSDFHTLRTGLIARRAGYPAATAIGAATPLYLRYNIWLREYFALVSSWALREY
uniref:YdcF family protein n=1 Tax=unclassified Variovorax TaxID=663243 RepID=UPI000D3D10CC